MKVAITGARGFIGQEVVLFLRQKGLDVLPLARDKLEEARGCQVVINLAGESIFGRWTQEKKRRMWQSRVETTEKLSRLLLNDPPLLYIGISAVGYYGDRQEEWVDEKTPQGKGFLAALCKAWEEAAVFPQSRVVFARLGIVLSKKGGALKKSLPPFKAGLGGKLGSGRQYWSWIALEDLLAALWHVIEEKSLSGPVNFATPSPVTNAVFTKTLGQVLHRPTICAIPGWFLKLAMGEAATEIFLSSTRVFPEKLQQSGFVFAFPDLKKCLQKNC